MQQVLSSIDNLEKSLLSYVDGVILSHSQNAERANIYDENKQNVKEACATLRAKYEMLAHCTGTLCRLRKIREEKPVEKEDDICEIDVRIGQDDHKIFIPDNPLGRINIVCNFYNIVNVAASFRDVLVKLITNLYQDQLKGKLPDSNNKMLKKLQARKLSSKELAEILGEKCPLGFIMNKFIVRSIGYRLIIELRDTLVHHTVVNILALDFINPSPIPQIDSKWTPDGRRTTLPDYAEMIYCETVYLLQNVCDCISSSPERCIIETGSPAI